MEHKRNNNDDKSIYDLLKTHTSIGALVNTLSDSYIRLTKESNSGRWCVTSTSRNVHWTALKESCVGMVIVLREVSDVVVESESSTNTDGHIEMDVVSFMSARPIQLRKDDSKIMREFAKHTVKVMEDGSVLGLYHYGGEWRVRTLKSYDATDMTWNGDITFGDVVKSIEERYSTFVLNDLDKSHCYSIGIKHTQLHPFLEGRDQWDNDIVRAWFIESVDMKKIKMGTTIKYATCYHDESMGLPEMSTTNMSLTTLIKKQDAALSDYIATGRIFFGVTISRDGGVKYKMRSSLYRAIEYYFYDTGDMNKLISDHGFNRQKYIVLNTFMYPNSTEHTNFLQLFPQYVADFDRFNVTLVSINATLCGMVAAGTTTYGGNVAGEYNTKFAAAVNVMYAALVRNSKGIPTVNTQHIVDTCSRRNFNTRTLYDIMYADAAPPSPAAESAPEPTEEQ
jgi:hypothetical protein